MRQSKESGNDSDREADKSGAAIEYALVELNKDIGWLGGMIGQFANKKSLAGSYRLKKYFRRSCKFPESSSDRALPHSFLGCRLRFVHSGASFFEDSSFVVVRMALTGWPQLGGDIRTRRDNVSKSKVSTLARLQPFTPNHSPAGKA